MKAMLLSHFLGLEMFVHFASFAHWNGFSIGCMDNFEDFLASRVLVESAFFENFFDVLQFFLDFSGSVCTFFLFGIRFVKLFTSRLDNGLKIEFRCFSVSCCGRSWLIWFS